MLALLISSACLSNVEPEIVRADAYSGSDTVGFSNGDFLIVYLSPDVNDTMPEWINASNTASLNVSLLTDPRTCWGSAYSAIWLEPRMMKITIDDASCAACPISKVCPPRIWDPALTPAQQNIASETDTAFLEIDFDALTSNGGVLRGTSRAYLRGSWATRVAVPTISRVQAFDALDPDDATPSAYAAGDFVVVAFEEPTAIWSTARHFGISPFLSREQLHELFDFGASCWGKSYEGEWQRKVACTASTLGCYKILVITATATQCPLNSTNQMRPGFDNLACSAASVCPPVPCCLTSPCGMGVSSDADFTVAACPNAATLSVRSTYLTFPTVAVTPTPAVLRRSWYEPWDHPQIVSFAASNGQGCRLAAAFASSNERFVTALLANTSNATSGGSVADINMSLAMHQSRTMTRGKTTCALRSDAACEVHVVGEEGCTLSDSSLVMYDDLDFAVLMFDRDVDFYSPASPSQSLAERVTSGLTDISASELLQLFTISDATLPGDSSSCWGLDFSGQWLSARKVKITARDATCPSANIKSDICSTNATCPPKILMSRVRVSKSAMMVVHGYTALASVHTSRKALNDISYANSLSPALRGRWRVSSVVNRSVATIVMDGAPRATSGGTDVVSRQRIQFTILASDITIPALSNNAEATTVTSSLALYRGNGESIALPTEKIIVTSSSYNLAYDTESFARLGIAGPAVAVVSNAYGGHSDRVPVFTVGWVSKATPTRGAIGGGTQLEIYGGDLIVTRGGENATSDFMCLLRAVEDGVNYDMYANATTLYTSNDRLRHYATEVGGCGDDYPACRSYTTRLRCTLPPWPHEIFSASVAVYVVSQGSVLNWGECGAACTDANPYISYRPTPTFEFAQRWTDVAFTGDSGGGIAVFSMEVVVVGEEYIGRMSSGASVFVDSTVYQYISPGMFYAIMPPWRGLRGSPKFTVRDYFDAHVPGPTDRMFPLQDHCGATHQLPMAIVLHCFAKTTIANPHAFIHERQYMLHFRGIDGHIANATVSCNSSVVQLEAQMETAIRSVMPSLTSNVTVQVNKAPLGSERDPFGNVWLTTFKRHARANRSEFVAGLFSMVSVSDMSNVAIDDAWEAAAHTAIGAALITGSRWKTTCDVCATTISAGYDTDCVLDNDGIPYCWGSNTFGQARPDASLRLTDVSVARDNSCGVQATSSHLVCWGGVGEGQLSMRMDAPMLRDLLPLRDPEPFQPPRGHIPPPEFNLTEAAVNSTYNATWNTTEEMMKFRLINATAPPTFMPTFQPEFRTTRYAAVSAAPLHTCAMVLNGSLACYGDHLHRIVVPPNTWCSGRRGTETIAESSFRYYCMTMDAYAAVDTSTTHSCAVNSSDGTVSCWGTWYFGETGVARYEKLQGRPSYGSAPVLGRGRGFVNVKVGMHYTCGMYKSGYIRCWGMNRDGQANPPRSMKVTEYSLGTHHACAIERGTGLLSCWGDNSWTRATNPLPSVAFLKVICGDRHTCGVVGDDASYGLHRGEVVCWGSYEVPDADYPWLNAEAIAPSRQSAAAGVLYDRPWRILRRDTGRPVLAATSCAVDLDEFFPASDVGEQNYAAIYFAVWTALAAFIMGPGVVWGVYSKKISCWRARTTKRIYEFLGLQYSSQKKESGLQ